MLAQWGCTTRTWGTPAPGSPTALPWGDPLRRWISRSPSGEPSAEGTSTMSAEQGSGCRACCAAGRLGHEPMQSSSLRAGGTARAGAGAGGRSVRQHEAPPVLHPLITTGKCIFGNTDLSPAQRGQRPCHGEAPSRHRDRHHQPPSVSRRHQEHRHVYKHKGQHQGSQSISQGGRAGVNHPQATPPSLTWAHFEFLWVACLWSQADRAKICLGGSWSVWKMTS